MMQNIRLRQTAPLMLFPEFASRVYKKTMKNCRFLKFWMNRVLICGILKNKGVHLRERDAIIILLEKEFRKL